MSWICLLWWVTPCFKSHSVPFSPSCKPQSSFKKLEGLFSWSESVQVDRQICYRAPTNKWYQPSLNIVPMRISAVRAARAHPAPLGCTPHEDGGTVLRCPAIVLWVLVSRSWLCNFKQKASIYKLQQGMEEKDKGDMTGDSCCVSWHLFLWKFVSGLCSKWHCPCLLSPPHYPSLLEELLPPGPGTVSASGTHQQTFPTVLELLEAVHVHLRCTWAQHLPFWKSAALVLPIHFLTGYLLSFSSSP